MFRSFPFAPSPLLRHRAIVHLLVCVLVCSLAPAPAWAQDAAKTIAIVNLGAADDAEATTAHARRIIARTPGVRPTETGDLAQALEGRLPEGGPDAPILADAQRALDESEAAFGLFKSRLATSKLGEARRSLFSATPNDRTTALLADLSFRMALIHLRADNMGLAQSEFELHHRLLSDSKIDPVRYPPSVVNAFEQARKNVPQKLTATLSITASYDGAPIFLDGKPVGTAPLSLPVAAGAHIIAIAAPKYEPAAPTSDIDPGDTQKIKSGLQPRSLVTRALELRFQAQESGYDEDSLRLAASRVSRLVGSDAVLIITGEKSYATLFFQQLDKLSYRSGVDATLPRMLALAMPVPRPTLLDGVIGGPEDLPWYRNPVGITALAVGSILLIVGGLSLGTSDDGGQGRLVKPEWDF